MSKQHFIEWTLVTTINKQINKQTKAQPRLVESKENDLMKECKIKVNKTIFLDEFGCQNRRLIFPNIYPKEGCGKVK